MNNKDINKTLDALDELMDGPVHLCDALAELVASELRNAYPQLSQALRQQMKAGKEDVRQALLSQRQEFKERVKGIDVEDKYADDCDWVTMCEMWRRQRDQLIKELEE